jgi:hypothetical protein
MGAVGTAALLAAATVAVPPRSTGDLASTTADPTPPPGAAAAAARRASAAPLLPAADVSEPRTRPVVGVDVESVTPAAADRAGAATLDAPTERYEARATAAPTGAGAWRTAVTGSPALVESTITGTTDWSTKATEALASVAGEVGDARPAPGALSPTGTKASAADVSPEVVDGPDGPPLAAEASVGGVKASRTTASTGAAAALRVVDLGATSAADGPIAVSLADG